MSLIINSSPLAGTQKPNHGSWKRKATTDDEDETRGETKRSRYQWYFTLESESPIPTDEDAESVYTIQGDETEYVQDTSDTSDTSSTHTYMTSDESDNDVSIHVEFELDSESNNSIDSSSSSEPENYLVNYISCSGSEGLADDSDISRCSLDSEVSHSIFKLCLQCKTLNTNPLFRYCQKCYQTKKIQYPRINRKRRMSKSQSQLSQLSSQASERQHLQSQSLTQIQRQLSEASTVVLGNSQELGSMDSGIATSQCDLDSGIASGSSQEVEVLLVEGRTSTRISQRDEIDSGHAPTEGDSDHSYSHSDVSTGLNMTKDKTSEFQSSSSEIRTPRQPKSLMRLLQQRHRRDLANISASSGISSGSGNTSGTIPKNSSLTSFSESELMIASSTGSGQQKCHTCDENQRDAVFVHGKTCHIFCCYTCAKKAWVTHNRRCPICNRQVTQILKAFYS